MRDLLFWVITGGIAGWLASIVVRTNERMGCLLNIVVGIIGGVIGGWLFRQLDLQAPGGEWLSAIVVSFVGAAILLIVLRLVRGR